MEDTSWKNKVTSNKKAVEAHLRSLQDSHRLAIHMWENENSNGQYPVQTLNDLSFNKDFTIQGLLHDGEACILSMSLLPGTQSGKSLIPFDVSSNSTNPGYLFDLTTDIRNPPRVVRVMPSMRFTGYDNYKKIADFDWEHKEGLPALDELYGKYTKHSFMHALADDITLSAQQLDALGHYYESPQWEHDERTAFVETNMVSLNEMLVAASREHIAAIAIPVYNATSLKSKSDELLFQLRGALAGLEHANNGMELPVVLYQVNPPNQGRCTYLAQGEKECRKVALNAIRELQHTASYTDKTALRHMISRFTLGNVKLEEDIRRLLEIDLYAPLDEQLKALASRDDAHQSATAPSHKSRWKSWLPIIIR